MTRLRAKAVMHPDSLRLTSPAVPDMRFGTLRDTLSVLEHELLVVVQTLRGGCILCELVLLISVSVIIHYLASIHH